MAVPSATRPPATAEDQSADEKPKANKELTALVHDTHTMHSDATADT